MSHGVEHAPAWGLAGYRDDSDGTLRGIEGRRGVYRQGGVVRGWVWGDVGLVLKAKYAGDGEAEGGVARVSFFLHHRDLAMEMVKVVGARVPVVEFRGVEVVLDFCSGRRGKGAGKKKKVKGVGEGRKAVVAVEEREPAAQKSHRYGLRRRPTTKVKETRRDAAAKEDDEKEDEEPPRYAWSIHEMATLLDVGLRKLLGVGRGPQGFRTTKSGPSPSLMEIAPGVWNLRYLQLLETHARAIPAIASGVARLANARSSQLREKVARLGLSGGPASEAADRVDCGEGVEEETRGRLWSLCQTKIQADPMAKTASQSREAAAKEEATYESGHLPLERYARIADDTGGSQEHLDVHDGQLIPFEASSSDLRYLPVELHGSMGSEVIYGQHVDPVRAIPGLEEKHMAISSRVHRELTFWHITAATGDCWE
ncbi:hypothetical protein QBC39DRAFT_433513 [Podospora conica]|nr:hypothetical protein QBC39DRAFT_433513 [Schizothecium conicum]